MKTILILLIGFFCSYNIVAQQSSSCSFDRLFNLKKGLSKHTVVDSVKNIYGLAPNNTSIKEQLIYDTKDIQCLNVGTSIIQFDFKNDKLEKAYIQSNFARADYYQMLDDVNALRNIIKTTYLREKEQKFSSGSLVANGYDFTKPNKVSADKISLRYINTKPDKGYGVYLLQVLWIHTGNDGIETIMY
ncbi:MAG: hypothetical protein ABI861_00420 [Panacibacter sp.]